MHEQTVCTACLMSEVSLGHIDTCGTHRVCLHATLSGGHLGGFTHHTPAWQTPHRHPITGSATAVLCVGVCIFWRMIPTVFLLTLFVSFCKFLPSLNFEMRLCSVGKRVVFGGEW